MKLGNWIGLILITLFVIMAAWSRNKEENKPFEWTPEVWRMVA